MEPNKNTQLLKIAKRRVQFKKHFLTYLLVNYFLWIIWFLNDKGSMFPWPLYPMLGWGIGVAINYYEAYFGYKEKLIEKEYEKLVREKDEK